ncbi:hypothetical protein B0A58_06515 [Flavobacterium branchiophilum NBRC 15030 = ATCC 35035]|uniref:DKNYY family protein n=1 Tax=Flavobacterium branchiophilum TaxID=55197 RepID=A0A543G826_9FLAO|nr:hypothetical protein [Flavobacterium branchiophilum]OXA76907.1 hypothetical protein B0A58_06515 [Flavobacterium branchiophilum NBRC 15030 = ATCC 35035]TQM42235.1 hypothetical protein BC670_3275 [Flavobacterium branchiophilum]GEM54313.1 hypothetical protein FB1_05340 [Flavobacterium branchiophilum NBRC 15030 = ATCC 35035]
MSQAAGLVSKIKISENAYKKFIKQEAATFAEELFISFWHKSATIYKLNYNKKLATLYVYAYYHYGSSETLQESLFYKAITKIIPFLDADSEGYCLTTLDCLSFSNFDVQLQIEKGIWKEQPFSTAERQAIYKETQKQFFNKIENVSDYTAFFNANRTFLDATVLKQFEILREEARIKTIKEGLHLATALQPLELFKGYFYNGTKFYHCNGRDAITYFENCNLQDLVETSYGLTDGNSIIIGNKQLIADPKSFKKLHKFYTTFYVTATNVYDEQLNEMEGADAKTFKLATYKREISNVYYGEDANHIYFLGKTISKEALGTFSFSNSLFYDEILLIGTKKIYLGATLLDEIDAPTYEKLRLENTAIYDIGKNTVAESTTYAGSMKAFISYGKDKNGEFFLFKPYVNAAEWCFVATSFGFKNNEVVVLRKNEAEFLEFYEKYKKEVAANALPFLNSILPENNLDSAAYFTQFQAFFESKHFDKLVEENKYVPDFLTKFNNYLHHCWQLYIHSNKKELHYLETGLRAYKKLAHHYIAELNPYIFHHLTCFSVVLKQHDYAVSYFLKAFYYGYSQFHLMLKDADLQALFHDPKIVDIKNWFEENEIAPYKETNDWRWYPNLYGYPQISALVFDLLEQLPDTIKQGAKHNYHQIDYVSYIMNTYLFFEYNDGTEEGAFLDEMLIKFAPYFNKYLQNTMDLSWQEHCAYFFYQDYAITNAKTHLVRLEYLFFKAHNEYGFNEMNEENLSDLVNRIQLKYQEASEADKGYIDQSKVMELLSNTDFVQKNN